MIGMILAVTSACCTEIGTTLGKYSTAQKKESLYAMGFFNLLWATIFYFAYAYWVVGGSNFRLIRCPHFSSVLD
jgi:hypothetical protein